MSQKIENNLINTAKNIERDIDCMINKKEEKKADWSGIRAFSDLYSDASREILIKAN